jgi:bifunctional N-acetylglucosamine-1-phosphate-uridyltransferase/glucosamine-1-phosphate-acetyltransferase GlmU-like protein
MSQTRPLISIILAGGLGKRMNSDIPKVLHIVNEKPMICHVIDRALELNSKNILIVVGKYRKIIDETIAKYYDDGIRMTFFKFIDQPYPVGTGNAVLYCIGWLNMNVRHLDPRILILSGDVPLISKETLMEFINYKQFSNILMTYELYEPKGYGRIIQYGDSGFIEKIIEEKDCTDIEKKIKTVNCGIYYTDYFTLFDTLSKINNRNATGEYYLTDIIELSFHKKGFTQYLLQKEKHIEIENINTREDLDRINSTFLSK